MRALATLPSQLVRSAQSYAIAVRDRRVAREGLFAMLISLVLPIVIVLWLPQGSITLTLMVWSAVLLLAPLAILFGVLLPWVQGEISLVRGILRSLILNPGANPGAPQPLATFPFVTLGLIALNLAAFTFGDMERMVLYYERNELTPFLSSLFAHADASHLSGNMLYLWIFGGALEARIGRLRYLGLYLGLGVLAGLCTVAEYRVGCAVLEETCSPEAGIIGASGAISAVMGLYMVRLYCTGAAVNPSLAAIVGLPIASRFSIPAPVFLVLCFSSEFADVAAGVNDGIGHSTHLYGYYGGLVCAFALGFLADGFRDVRLSRARRVKTTEDGYSISESIEEALELDGDDVELRVEKARHHLPHAPEAAAAEYRRAIEVLLQRREVRQAAEVFVELFRVTGDPLEVAQQLCLTPRLVALGERRVAADALERLALDPEVTHDFRAKVLAYLGKLLVEIGAPEAAQDTFERLVREFPDHPASGNARAYLEKTNG